MQGPANLAGRAFGISRGGIHEKIRVELDDRAEARDVDAADAVDVIRGEIDATVASSVKVVLELGSGRFRNELVEQAAVLVRVGAERVLKGAKVEWAARGAALQWRRNLSCRSFGS